MADDTTELKTTIEEATKRAAKAQLYRLRDGTMVQRPFLGDLMRARRELQAEEAVKNRGGLFVRIGFERP